jgi:hypothetical protein
LHEPSRIIHHTEAFAWLEKQPVLEASFITSMPDFSEFPNRCLEDWKKWFCQGATRIFEKCSPDGVAIFYQRDRKVDGTWIDKSYLIQRSAEEEGIPLLWHKIVCRAPPNQPTFGSTGYSHLLCFSKNIRAEMTVSTADILPHAGETTWTRGMGIKACQVSVNFVKNHTSTKTIVDPFCGHGTVLAVANALGLDAIGVEKGRKRAEKAEQLKVKL